MTVALNSNGYRRLDLPPLPVDWTDGVRGRPMPKSSRQARRHAERLRAKGREPAPHGLTPTGVLLAAELPVHQAGQWRLRDGWVSELDGVCWHEAAHATVALHFGFAVRALAVAEGDDATGTCDFHATWGRGTDAGAHGWRGLATAAWAGADVACHIRRGLGLADPIPAECISDLDLRTIATVLEHVPEPEPRLRDVCGIAAVIIVLKHQRAFAALVAALLEHGSLDEEQIRAVWDATEPQRPVPPAAVAPGEPPAATLVVEGTLGALNGPKQIARDAAGNLYVADSQNDKVQKFDAAGVHQSDIVTSVDAVTGVAVDASGNVYVAYKSGTTKRLAKYDSAGAVQWTVSLEIGTLSHLATDNTHLYATDLSNNNVRKRLCSDGSSVANLGTSGSGDGQFSVPVGIAYSATTGTLYVTDQGNDRVQILTTTGAFVAKFGSAGSGDGQFGAASGIAVSSTGAKVWVADATLDRVQLFTGTGAFLAKFGSTGTGDGEFNTPDGIVLASNDLSAWVVDFTNDRVQRLDDSGGPYAAQSTSSVIANTGKGWHPAWESEGEGGTPTKIVVSDTAKDDGSTDYRAFWGVGEECWSFQCRLDTHSSRQAIQTGTGERFASTGSYLEWGPFHGGSIAIPKLASHVALLMEHATAADYVAYQYMTQAQHEEAWVTLGEATTDAGDDAERTVLPFGVVANGANEFSEGLSFRWIRQRLLWVGSTALSPAIVTALTLAYLPVTQDAATKAYTVWLPPDRDPLTGKTADQIVNTLEGLLSEERFLYLMDGQKEFRCYFSSISYGQAPTTDGPGALTLSVIQIPTNAGGGLIGED